MKTILARILPLFTARTGIEVRVLAQGTGQALATAALEKRLWRDTGINPAGAPWYKDIGGGMGAALNVAAATDATTLTDRGTWLSFANRRDLVELVHGDPRLINRYRVIELAPGRHKSGAIAAAHSLAQWFAGPEAQTAIGAFTVGGKALFNPGVKDIR
jgi:tungstate transport system substrate-binding protein